ncbi:hypothetical protein WJ978_19275 [Achromobacter xylosoxidans]
MRHLVGGAGQDGQAGLGQQGGGEGQAEGGEAAWDKCDRGKCDGRHFLLKTMGIICINDKKQVPCLLDRKCRKTDITGWIGGRSTLAIEIPPMREFPVDAPPVVARSFHYEDGQRQGRIRTSASS